MSACVKWVKEEVDAFNAILGRQLSSVQRDGDVWRECMERARAHAKVLEEVHLDFRDLIGKDVDAWQAGGSASMTASAAAVNGGGPVGLGLT